MTTLSAMPEGVTPSADAVVVGVLPSRDGPVLATGSDPGQLACGGRLGDMLKATPGNDLYPASFAALAGDYARAAGLDVDVMHRQELIDGGYGGILAVGSGSAHEPCLVRVSYRAPRPTAHVALVGKGITFDAGGLTLKIGTSMLHQQKDMVGAATVLAAAVAAAELNVALDLTVYLPLAENMPSGTAYRPGDVLKMRNGMTVEVRNTDAEGRLVLADGVARACEDEPDYLLSVASLTGAQRIALGTRTSGAVGDDSLTALLDRAGRHTGEHIWPMPIPDDVELSLHSSVADFANWIPETAGGMLRGGVFVSKFITETTRWAHVDIAGPSYNTGMPYGYIPTGATGAPLRALVHSLEQIVGWTEDNDPPASVPAPFVGGT